MDTSDVIVVGGGLVGSAIAYGLSRMGQRVVLLDEGDVAWRASRGNFGLVWVQGKGYGLSAYARWSLGSARMWPELASGLFEETGENVQLQQGGGFHLCLSEKEVDDRRKRLQWLQDEVGVEDYPFEMLDPQAVRSDLPGLGPAVQGVSFSPMDGHANPLRLLRALHMASQKRGMRLHVGAGVQDVRYEADVYTVTSAVGKWQAPRIVIAAGLGSKALAEKLGMFIPVRPNKGQVLITDRQIPLLRRPTNYVRQTGEGTVQVGDSMEEAGLDDVVRVSVSAEIAARAVRCFPWLKDAKLVRTWAALRVMTPDGFPIYQQSESCPGAFAVSCHSGVTLAARHALTVAPWIAGGALPDGIEPFAATRFDPDTPIAHYGH